MRQLFSAALAAGLIAWTGTGIASDTVRLVDNDQDRAADADGGTDTYLTAYRGGGFGGYRGGYGGYRGGYGGYRGGYGYGGYRGGYGYGGYRGYGYGGYGYGRGFSLYLGSPYYGGYGYRSYYGGYRPYYGGYYGVGSYGSYYPSYYYSTPTYAAPAYSYYSPCGDAAPAMPPVSTANYSYSQPLPRSVLPPQAVPSGNGTYPYDGGPRAPLPMPGADDANPISGPRPTVPLEGRLVSLPKQTTGGVSSLETQFVSFNQEPQSRPAAVNPQRYAFPAYGEQNLPPVTWTRK